MKKGIVVYRFAGIGKTYICNKFENACDLEEEMFRYLSIDHNNIERNKGISKKENEDFPNNYFRAIEEALLKYDYVFVSYNAIKYCQEHGIKYMLFFPSLNQKKDYLNRYIQRGNSQNFIDNLAENYEKFIKKESKDSYAEEIVFLKKNEFLEDSFKRLGLIKKEKLLPYKRQQVSLIVPIFNSANYLERLLDSIKKQTHNSIEVILVNDGSTDNSEDICKDFIKNYSNAKYIYKKNGGVSSARNTGLKYVTGKYVCFLDSDDCIEENYCKCLINALEKNDCDFAMAGIYEHVKNDVNEYGLKEKCSFSRYDAEMFVKIFNPYWFPVLWNKIYKMNIIKNHKIKFPEKISYDEDTIFNLKYYQYARRICIVPQKLYHYYIHDNSLTSKGSSLVYENSLMTIPYRLGIPKKLFGENKRAVYVSAKKILKSVLQQLKLNYKKRSSIEEIETQFYNMINNNYVKKATKYICALDDDYCEYRKYYKIFVEKSTKALIKYII